MTVSDFRLTFLCWIPEGFSNQSSLMTRFKRQLRGPCGSEPARDGGFTFNIDVDW